MLVMCVICIDMTVRMRAEPHQQVDSIAVNSGRPLASVIKEFEDRYGWIVTYEDPRYSYQKDLKDVTEAVRNPASTNVSGLRVVVPKAGPLVVSFVRPSPDAGASQVLEVVRSLVQNHNGSGYPGVFEAISADDLIHVVPTQVVARDGGIASNSSVLDVSMSLPTQEKRNAFQTIEAVLAKVESVTGFKIAIGTVPTALLVGTVAEEEVLNQSARHILARTLRATGKGLSWRLLYGPDVRYYALNLRIVNDGKAAQ